MVAKKILFKIAGIIQIITSAFIGLISGVILLLRPLLNMVIENAFVEFQEYAKNLTEEGLAEVDESMRFLLDASK